MAWKPTARRQAVLRSVLPGAAAHRTTILLKSHQSSTPPRCSAAPTAPDTAHVRVAYDPVNIVTRGEDPLQAASRLADLTDMIAVDDMIITTASDGIVRIPVPVGTGDLPCPSCSRSCRPQPSCSLT